LPDWNIRVGRLHLRKFSHRMLFVHAYHLLLSSVYRYRTMSLTIDNAVIASKLLIIFLNVKFIFISYLWRFRSEEHTSELQSRENLVCRLPLEKKTAL